MEGPGLRPQTIRFDDGGVVDQDSDQAKDTASPTKGGTSLRVTVRGVITSVCYFAIVLLFAGFLFSISFSLQGSGSLGGLITLVGGVLVIFLESIVFLKGWLGAFHPRVFLVLVIAIIVQLPIAAIIGVELFFSQDLAPGQPEALDGENLDSLRS